MGTEKQTYVCIFTILKKMVIQKIDNTCIKKNKPRSVDVDPELYLEPLFNSWSRSFIEF